MERSTKEMNEKARTKRREPEKKGGREKRGKDF